MSWSYLQKKERNKKKKLEHFKLPPGNLHFSYVYREKLAPEASYQSEIIVFLPKHQLIMRARFKLLKRVKEGSDLEWQAC